MDLGNFIKGQFIDVIEHVDETNKLLVYKYERYGNEIKNGSSLIVREGQAAVFIYKGQIADIFSAGSYTLTTKNLPILSSLKALPHLFNSPIKSDLYFLNITQFIGNRWGTKNPILMRDKDFGIVRITAFGSYSFRINNPAKFLREIFGARKINITYDILQFLNSFVSEAITGVLAEVKIPVLDLAADYRGLSDMLRQKVNERAESLGLVIEEAVIENISLPPEVEKIVDEQSGLGLASHDMDTYMQYQTIRAMRDASKQKNGLAGLGAGLAFGNHIAGTISKESSSDGDPVEKLLKYKKLLDDGILSQDEFDSLKRKLLSI